MESQANTNKEWEMRNIRRADADRKLSEKRMERMGLLNGRSADEFEAALKRDLKTAEDQRKSGEEKYNQWDKEWNGENSLLKEQESGLVVLEKMRVEAIAAMNAWLQQFADKEHHSIDRAELDRWLGHDAAWIDEEQRQIDIVSNALVTARGKATAAKESLEAHIRTKPTADDALTVENEMIRLKRDLENARAEADTKRAVILNDDARKQQSGRLLDQLQLQEKQALPWRKLNALIGSADGTKFRDMAQQWTLDVLLKHANAQLGSLADRYRLERLRDSLNLLVIDREMDGQQRSVHSLSGGESFLVSLGLALGLASITSNKLAIESLFIDEGFGSLDSDTLRTALNALGHLEDQGRKVGVISHVRELVDAIPVQVRVVRGPGGASRVVI
jgi:exonuclease SbcC